MSTLLDTATREMERLRKERDALQKALRSIDARCNDYKSWLVPCAAINDIQKTTQNALKTIPKP